MFPSVTGCPRPQKILIKTVISQIGMILGGFDPAI
jgi:hypothetical protein